MRCRCGQGRRQGRKMYTGTEWGSMSTTTKSIKVSTVWRLTDGIDPCYCIWRVLEKQDAWLVHVQGVKWRSTWVWAHNITKLHDESRCIAWATCSTVRKPVEATCQSNITTTGRARSLACTTLVQLEAAYASFDVQNPKQTHDCKTRRTHMI